MAPKLQPNGKPMRALRVLADLGIPLTETTVYWRSVRSSPTGGSFHAALDRLVRLGLAERSGARGPRLYQITPAGREYLEDR